MRGTFPLKFALNGNIHGLNFVFIYKHLGSSWGRTCSEMTSCWAKMLISSLDTNKRKTGIWRQGYGWMSMQFGPIRRGSKADKTGGLALPHLRYFAWAVNCKKDPKKCPNRWFTDIKWGKTKRESEGSPPELPALSNLKDIKGIRHPHPRHGSSGR